MELRAAIGGGKYAVGVAARLPIESASGVRPLLRTDVFQQAIAQTADVEVAPRRQCAVFVENSFGRREIEQIGAIWAQQRLHADANLLCNPPVGHGLAGAGTAWRTREMRRSELVTVPPFSPHAAAGSTTSAYGTVSVCRKASCTTTNSAALSASRILSISGIEWTGLVQTIQTALMRPVRIASNISTAAIRAAPDKVSTPITRPLRPDVPGWRCRDARRAWLPCHPPRVRPSRSVGQSAKKDRRRGDHLAGCEMQID